MVQTAEIAGITVELARQEKVSIKLNEEIEAVKYPLVLPTFSDRPSLTPLFVGREDEIGNVNQTLMKYGSCVISQNGGGGRPNLQLLLLSGVRL